GIELASRLLGIGKPTGAEFAKLGELLMAGDPMMDGVVDEMATAGMNQTRPLFEQALTDGIDTVDGAPRRWKPSSGTSKRLQTGSTKANWPSRPK
ncbi:MAG: hypothetical protein WBG47_00295, partial [Gordonia sp. (in: high G+C Gram-positive bacteria)]